jgi:hypothetical protein
MGVGMSSESDQRDFIQRFIHKFHEDQRLAPPTRAEAQEMESVLYSVSFGKQEIFKKSKPKSQTLNLNENFENNSIKNCIFKNEKNTE